MLVLGLCLLLSSSYAIEVHNCTHSHGMENGKLPDSSITASSYRPWHDPHKARLNNVKKPKDVASWCTDNTTSGQWIQIDLGKRVVTTKIATQGRAGSPYPKYVSSYRVAYSNDGVNFTFYKSIHVDRIFVGNINNDDIRENDFPTPITARYIRVYPLTFVGVQICMRLDLYGCEGRTCSKNKGGCSHECIQVDDMITKCDCPSGYELDQGGSVCKNIDECARGTALCNQGCSDNRGSYSCWCYDGYEKIFNMTEATTCIDIDECIRQSHNCTQKCLNNQGSFDCDCFTGYRNIGRGYCRDINECIEESPGCSYECRNIRGSYYCACPDGYQVGADKKQCVDIDECTSSAKCDQVCHNSPGSYNCSCYAGFELNFNNYTCDNINECETEKPCDLQTTNCIDTAPGYHCSCKTGFEPSSSPTSCKRVTCNALTAVTGTFVSPSRCLLDGQNLYQDKCYFGCHTGYEPAKPNNMTLQCEANRAWNDSLPYCKRSTCSPLASPANGLVSPSRCSSTGAPFDEKCHFTCQNGYKLIGPTSVTCQSDKSYQPAPVVTCKTDVPAPWITCPSNIIATLAQGENKASVSDQWEQPTANVPNISIRPSYINKDYLFPAGANNVTFVATDSVGREATCYIFVTIRDREPPVITCPPNQFITTTQDKIQVTWPEPTAKDNVKVTSLTSSLANGQERYAGTYSVSYIARDAAGNSGSCGFNVYIKKKECRSVELQGLKNCKKTCQANGQYTFCSATHDSDRLFFYSNPMGIFAYCMTGTWTPAVLPDCVLFKLKNGTCPDGMIEGTGAYDNKCLNCPAGTYFDQSKSTCTNCPVDTYQEEEGSLSCKACSATRTTGTLTGARSYLDCHTKCRPGRYSSTGYHDAENSPCQLCPLNHYQDQRGSTSCNPCPDQYITKQSGTANRTDCGLPASITRLHPNGNVTITEKQTISFVCKVEGDPEPVVVFRNYHNIPDGFGGLVKKMNLYDANGKLLGVKYTIIGVTEHNQGFYYCRVTNGYGSEYRSVYLTVQWDYSTK